MAMYLTGSTALAFWRWKALTRSCSEVPARTRLTHFGICTESLAEIRAACEPFCNDAPIHVTCANRRNGREVRFHHCTTRIPDGSLFRLNDRLFVASPELALMHTVRGLPAPAALLALCEACGTYAIDHDDMRGFRDRPPLSSTGKLVRFAERARGLSGARPFGKIARNAVDGAASPREAAAALILGLPTHLGGYGLGLPRLNQEIPLVTPEHCAFGHRCFRVDMLWEGSSVALEYESDAFHSQAADIARDSRRRNILDALGIEVVTMTNAELKSVADTERIARRIAKRLGSRMRIRATDHAAKHSDLRRALLAPSARSALLGRD